VLQQPPQDPDQTPVTTAPVLGQPGAAFPVASPSGRAGLLAVPVAVVAVAAVLSGLLAVHTALGLVLAGAGLAVLVGFQATLWTRQRRLTGALQRSQSSFSTLVKGSVDPVVILDDRLRLTFASQGIADLLGFDPTAVAGMPVVAAVHPDDRAALHGALNADRSRPDELAVRTARVRHADSRWRLIQATVRDVRADPDGGALVLYCRDVTGRVPAAGIDPDLHEFSLTDPVTGLPNRAALVRRLGAVQRAHGRPFSLALVRISGLEATQLAAGAWDVPHAAPSPLAAADCSAMSS
jgi:PAS domain S-box-containing protein